MNLFELGQEQKLQKNLKKKNSINHLKNKDKNVIMVGDGINDSVALAKSISTGPRLRDIRLRDC